MRPLGALLCLYRVLVSLARSCSPVCLFGVLCCVCGVLGDLAPVHRCARVVSSVASAVSWATWLLYTGAPARCVVLCVWCPGPLGACSPVCQLGVLCCVCRVLSHLAPVHRYARSVCSVVLRVLSLATWLLFTGVRAPSFALLVRCPGPLGYCSPMRLLGALLCPCGVLGHIARVHLCAHSLCCVGCVVSWAPWLLFTAVPARCVVLRVRCAGPLGSCSPVCPLGVFCPLRGVLGYLAPVHQCARSVCCMRVRCPGPLGPCSPVCPLGVLCCVYGVLGDLAPVHWCASSVCCGACTTSWATWPLFTAVPARCVVLRVWCPWSVSSCSPVCPLGVLCRVCTVVGHLAPVHQRACFVCCVACAVSWAPGSCSPVGSLGGLLCMCGLLGHLASFHLWACLVWCVVLRVRCPGPLVSCSPMSSLGVMRWVCGVLGHLAPVHRCARSLCCAVGAYAGRRCRVLTRPSGPRLFRDRQGRGSPRGAHSSV